MEYTELLEKQIIGRLKVDNSWWVEGVIPDYFLRMSPRLYLNIFMPLLQSIDFRRALILMGPRRVGKTVMLFHSIVASLLKILYTYRWRHLYTIKFI